MVGIVGFQSEPIRKKSLLKSLRGITQKLCKDHGIDMQDIGLIVHTGMYRQNFRVEPAFAAHLQQALKIRCENIGLNTKHVFSFDVTDGICGPHHALETIADLLPEMDCTYALFTAGDVRPTKETEWEHDPISFAALLSRDGPIQLLESRYDAERLNEFTSSTKFKKKHHGTTMTSIALMATNLPAHQPGFQASNSLGLWNGRQPRTVRSSIASRTKAAGCPS